MPRLPARRGPGFLRSLNYLAFLPLASRAPTYGRLLMALLADDRIPPSRKAILGLAAGYLLSPIDLIPEAIPILGALDDVAVVIIALDVFLEGVPRSLLDERLQELGIDGGELDADLARVRRTVPRPVRALFKRLPAAIDGAASLIRRSGADRRLRDWISKEEALPA
ncbi:MAG: DUF1232 domain-containing protein [Chloroflexi bacterium]|nr:DUF1232 domain-containing protein [Chloroflexota bacterium]